MIKVGKLVEDLKEPKNNYILSRKDGFKVRGADNEGVCYSAYQSVLSSAISTTTAGIVNPKVQSTDEELYFDDPLLTFDDSVVYGCKVQLNLQEL